MSGRSLFCFDLDGTLEDSRVDMVRAVQRVRASLGLGVRGDEDIRPHVNKGMRKLYELCFDDHLAGEGPGEPRYEEVKARYEADYLAHVVDHTRLYEGIEAALPEVARLGALAVVTNKPEHISRALVEALGVARFFATVVGGDSCAEEKPSPLPFRLAAERVGPPLDGRAFMIGDTAGDMKTARAAGATSVWCAWGYVDRPGDEVPDLIADQPAALPGLLRRALAG